MFLANLFDISFSDGKPCHITFLRLSDIGGPITARKTWICIKKKKNYLYFFNRKIKQWCLTNIQPIQQLELLWFSLNSFEAQETTKALHYSCGFYYSLYKCVNTVQYFLQKYFKLDVFDKLDSSNTYTTSFQFWFLFDYIFRLSNLYLIQMHRINLKATFDSVNAPFNTYIPI